MAAIMGDPTTLFEKLVAPGAGSVAGVDALEDLLHPGLAAIDNRGVLQARLAEAVPTTDNGLWRVLPDGRMEITWKLKPTAQWHDGVPFTADDLVFSLQVGQDKDLPFAQELAYQLIEGIERVDALTVTVKWTKPYINADALFTRSLALPLPKHLLESAYLGNKPNLPQLAYWNQEFVGTGPFKLREWAPSSHLILEANDLYVLGRPKIDEIRVRFIADPNTFSANFLAGDVELSLGRSLSLDQAIQLRGQWTGGRVDTEFIHWLMFYPQFINPDPPIVANAQFRRALLHALDRQELADTIQHGQVPVAHSMINPAWEEYRYVEPNIVRYAYDPRTAEQLITGLGYVKRTDGFFYDAGGQRLSLELRTTGNLDVQMKTIFPMADYWQRIGVAVDPVPIPTQRVRDPEYRATFPALEMVRNPNEPDRVIGLHSSGTPLPENRFSGSNRTRYKNLELDALVDKYVVAIPLAERMQMLGQIIHHMTDQLNLAGLFYDSEPSLIGNRLQQVTARSQRASQAWNAHEWDLRG